MAAEQGGGQCGRRRYLQRQSHGAGSTCVAGASSRRGNGAAGIPGATAQRAGNSGEPDGCRQPSSAFLDAGRPGRSGLLPPGPLSAVSAAGGRASFGGSGALAHPAPVPSSWWGSSREGMTAAGRASEASPAPSRTPALTYLRPGPLLPGSGWAETAFGSSAAARPAQVPVLALVLFLFIQHRLTNRHCAVHLAHFLISVESVKDVSWASSLICMNHPDIFLVHETNSNFLHMGFFLPLLPSRTEPSLPTHLFSQQIFHVLTVTWQQSLKS